MSDSAFIDRVLAAVDAMPAWELLAVVLALAYLLLAMKERIECWYAALVSTSIYTVLFWDVNLLMESALQVYYLVMAVYGWYQWRGLSAENGKSSVTSSAKLTIKLWSIRQHALALLSVIFLVMLSGYLLSENTAAAMPYLDSFTTWGSVITTYMVAKKILENWIYWLVVDSVSIYLYWDRGLYLTTLLFCLYIIIVIYGFFHWNKLYRQQKDRQPL